MKRENKHCMERKKRSPVSNWMLLIHSNVSNRIIIHSNVSKFLKKEHTATLYCFANECSLDGGSNSMDERFFLNKIEVTRMFPLTWIEEQSKEWVNISQVAVKIS